VEVIIPKAEDREIIHACIYQELVRGEISASSKHEFQRIIEDLRGKGAEGVILGCTEIPMLIQQDDVEIPLFDTTSLHVEAALKRAIN
jgi:aspartate racemase